MFDRVTTAPADPILGLSEAFKSDPNPAKINLAVGVFKDAAGATPVLESVKAAERELLVTETTKSYMPIDGSPEYGRLVQLLMLGGDHPSVLGGRVHTANTPGGTGALRVAGDYLKQNHPEASIWVSTPTWANHEGIFTAAGLAVKKYDYLDKKTNSLDIDGMLATIAQMPAGDVILLHGCCHNPTGVDPTAMQWQQIAEAVYARGVLPLADFAYQGFGDGLDEDAAGLRTLVSVCGELLICSSFSKNFGLYRDRVGALSVVTQSQVHVEAVSSQIKVAIRRIYSNPPAHGAAVVTTILSDEAKRRQWEDELDAMRKRIHAMRTAFADGLDQRGVRLTPEGNGFVKQQKGMFTMSGLTPEHVAKLRDKYSIYIVGSGRINVAGMTEQNLPVLCDAIADATAEG